MPKIKITITNIVQRVIGSWLRKLDTKKKTQNPRLAKSQIKMRMVLVLSNMFLTFAVASLLVDKFLAQANSHTISSLAITLTTAVTAIVISCLLSIIGKRFIG